MSGEGRFLTLMSNTDLDYFPDNSPSNFRNLVDPYYINGGSGGSPPNLKIAMRSCFLPAKYRNVHNGECFLIYKKKESDSSNYRKTPFEVESGYYATPKELCEKINISLKTQVFGGARKNIVQFVMSKKYPNRCEVKFQFLEFDIELATDVAKILGFALNQVIKCPASKGTVTAAYTASVNANKTELFIYLSTISNSCVGNKGYPLLEIVSWSPDNAANKPSQFISKDRLYWHRLVGTRIEDMAIEITDSTGEKMDFFGSNSIFTFEIVSV